MPCKVCLPADCKYPNEYMYACGYVLMRMQARSLGHNPPGPAGPHSLPAILTPDSAPGASPPSGKLVPLRKRHSELPSEVRSECVRGMPAGNELLLGCTGLPE
eukprot:964562-Pelagomonas_calceolata.AAC.2